MGNFTQDAFFRKVSPRVRREMAEWAREALLRSGAPAAEIPWPSEAEAPKGKPDLVVVVVTLIRRFEALGRELRELCEQASEVKKAPNAAAIAERGRQAYDFYYSYEHVAQDLFNTIAGDLVWEQSSGSKRLGQVVEKLQNPIGVLKNEFYQLHAGTTRGSQVHFSMSVQLFDVALKRLKGLAERVEAAARPAPDGGDVRGRSGAKSRR